MHSSSAGQQLACIQQIEREREKKAHWECGTKLVCASRMARNTYILYILCSHSLRYIYICVCVCVA